MPGHLSVPLVVCNAGSIIYKSQSEELVAIIVSRFRNTYAVSMACEAGGFGVESWNSFGMGSLGKKHPDDSLAAVDV